MIRPAFTTWHIGFRGRKMPSSFLFVLVRLADQVLDPIKKPGSNTVNCTVDLAVTSLLSVVVPRASIPGWACRCLAVSTFAIPKVKASFSDSRNGLKCSRCQAFDSSCGVMKFGSFLLLSKFILFLISPSFKRLPKVLRAAQSSIGVWMRSCALE